MIDLSPPRNFLNYVQRIDIYGENVYLEANSSIPSVPLAILILTLRLIVGSSKIFFVPKKSSILQSNTRQAQKKILNHFPGILPGLVLAVLLQT